MQTKCKYFFSSYEIISYDVLSLKLQNSFHFNFPLKARIEELFTELSFYPLYAFNQLKSPFLSDDKMESYGVDLKKYCFNDRWNNYRLR